MLSFLALATPFLAAAALAAPHDAQTRLPPAAPAGSFLHRQARSVTQLVQEVLVDPTTRRRFSRHFHIPEGQVAGFFSHSLRAATLPHLGSYTVFFVAGSGLIYPTRMELPPGTRVFVGRDGRPILLAGSGDPLMPFVTAVEIQTIDSPDMPPRSQEQIVPATGADIPVPATPGP